MPPQQPTDMKSIFVLDTYHKKYLYRASPQRVMPIIAKTHQQRLRARSEEDKMIFHNIVHA
jgi:hypothetical protein